MTMFKDVISLVNVTITKDDLLQEIEVKSNREVFANKKSIAQSEFFNAGQTGIKPEYQFVIRVSDYDNEKELIYNNKTYLIYRTYEKGENIELYCEVRVGGN
ncbi:SPP1 family predicted phage head-tail adaptor [Ureibacillus xyleni]|uniref:SPP1 family predicted phage head-tail adaptor n=2 Tax=Ureibacillus xyleni TaxID=614648 RepID=A0A285SXP0_9BACL|nr:SPP1 family predicted phage head-tail adaptor [Ureibacillus xyleni]